jgi:hypothetical protein
MLSRCLFRRGLGDMSIDNKAWRWNVGVVAYESGRLLFELPVYRVSLEQWHREKNERAERSRRDYKAIGCNVSDNAIHQIMWYHHGGVRYPYNQIIGWLRVTWDGPSPVIMAYAYQMKGKRYAPNFKPRHFEPLGNAFVLDFENGAESNMIVTEIRAAALGTVKRNGQFSGRWIDLEAFETLAPVIDFAALFDQD